MQCISRYLELPGAKAGIRGASRCVPTFQCFSEIGSTIICAKIVTESTPVSKATTITSKKFADLWLASLKCQSTVNCIRGGGKI